jgi:uncharacterized protein (DUF1499 family)
MARHQDPGKHASRLALWARRVAIFSLSVALLAIIIVRSGILEIVPALATFAASLVLAVVALVLAVAASIVIWKDGISGIGATVAAFFIVFLLLAYPAYLAVKASRLPEIADITTDPIDPPRFEAIARLRTTETNPANYAGLYAADQQRQAYPDIEPLIVDSNVKATYDAALAIITKRRWLVLDARPPLAGRREGRIEAVARTPIMGFRDDVVVRIRANGQGARLDVRSASRYGRHDLGTNATRIRSLTEDIDDLLDSEKPAKPVQKAKATQPPAKGSQPTKSNQPVKR